VRAGFVKIRSRPMAKRASSSRNGMGVNSFLW
jgi:hypothetical protein